MRSEKWGGMYIDLLPGDEIVDGSVIKAQLEHADPATCVVSLYILL